MIKIILRKQTGAIHITNLWGLIDNSYDDKLTNISYSGEKYKPMFLKESYRADDTEILPVIKNIPILLKGMYLQLRERVTRTLALHNMIKRPVERTLFVPEGYYTTLKP